jgi:hypothetical protein
MITLSVHNTEERDDVNIHNVPREIFEKYRPLMENVVEGKYGSLKIGKIQITLFLEVPNAKED